MAPAAAYDDRLSERNARTIAKRSYRDIDSDEYLFIESIIESIMLVEAFSPTPRTVPALRRTATPKATRNSADSIARSPTLHVLAQTYPRDVNPQGLMEEILAADIADGSRRLVLEKLLELCPSDVFTPSVAQRSIDVHSDPAEAELRTKVKRIFEGFTSAAELDPFQAQLLARAKVEHVYAALASKPVRLHGVRRRSEEELADAAVRKSNPLQAALNELPPETSFAKVMEYIMSQKYQEKYRRDPLSARQFERARDCVDIVGSHLLSQKTDAAVVMPTTYIDPVVDILKESKPRIDFRYHDTSNM